MILNIFGEFASWDQLKLRLSSDTHFLGFDEHMWNSWTLDFGPCWTQLGPVGPGWSLISVNIFCKDIINKCYSTMHSLN